MAEGLAIPQVRELIRQIKDHRIERGGVFEPLDCGFSFFISVKQPT